MSKTLKKLLFSMAVACLVLVATFVHAGSGTITISGVTNTGGGTYKLTVNSTTGMTVGDHLGARTGSSSGPGGLWAITTIHDATSVTVSDTLTEENGTTFGSPIAGSAWFSTPTTDGYSRIPHKAVAYDAALRRDHYQIDAKTQPLDAQLTDVAGLAVTDGGFIVGNGTNFVLETGATARASLGLTIGTDVQASDSDLTAIAALTPTKGNLVVGNGSAWVAVGVGTNGQVLHAASGAASGVAWDTDDGAAGAAHDIISATHTDYYADGLGIQRGDIMYVGSNAQWTRLPKGANNTVLGSDGTDATYRTVTALIDTLTGATTQGSILYRNGTVWVALGPGTAGQVLQSGGAGANPSWTSASSGQTRKYAYIRDEASSGTNGGTFTSGSWITRALDTEVYDPNTIVSISSNEFTLAAGTYEIFATAPGYLCTAHQARLYDVTGAAAVVVGTTERATADCQTRSIIRARVTPGSSNVYRIEHQCSNTKNDNGLGVPASFGTEVYTEVQIYKVE
jgi:hypothetical protein